MKPLSGLLIVDFSQFLSGPSASLRMADMGARVIKIERTEGGDLCRRLYVSNLELDGDSTIFHTINRNKESFAANLRKPEDRDAVTELVKRADVIIQNFRPGVMERLGFDYDSVVRHNERVVYGEITGYGKAGPWRDKPGQDLLAQCLSGLPWLNGDADQPPVPFGLAIADMLAGAHLVQGILACLVRRGIIGKGGHVEVSLLESVLDFQFEVLTTHLNDGGQPPRRSAVNNAHAYLGAPYGVYQTTDGYLALAMQPVVRLGELLSCPALLDYTDPKALFEKRDEIKGILAAHLRQNTTAHWLSILEPADIWCSDVFTWAHLLDHEAFQSLDFIQQVTRREGVTLRTTRCPIRIDGQMYKSPVGAPELGQHTAQILAELAAPAQEARA